MPAAPSEGSTADSSRAPSRTCDPEIIRAAWSTDILGRLGAQLRKPRGDPSTYALSHATMQIDGFVSHSWRHSGFRKFLALCYYYNNVPAICVALVATGDGRWSPCATWKACRSCFRTNELSRQVCKSNES